MGYTPFMMKLTLVLIVLAGLLYGAVEIVQAVQRLTTVGPTF